VTLPRFVFAAAVAAAATYALSWTLKLPPVADIAWKGAGVGLLAVYAALTTRGADGRLLVAVMALCALGDMLLEVVFVGGALAFLAGHLVAIGLYLRNRRTPLSRLDAAAALALIPLIVGAAAVLPVDRASAPGVAVYATGLAAMAAAAWLSRFPRPLTAAGALMFAVSDLLIFARSGRPALEIAPINLAVWGLYFAGQALICMGVTRTLPRRQVLAR
jgi:uncharacterized membrane protein YhhN